MYDWIRKHNCCIGWEIQTFNITFCFCLFYYTLKMKNKLSHYVSQALKSQSNGYNKVLRLRALCSLTVHADSLLEKKQIKSYNSLYLQYSSLFFKNRINRIALKYRNYILLLEHTQKKTILLQLFGVFSDALVVSWWFHTTWCWDQVTWRAFIHLQRSAVASTHLLHRHAPSASDALPAVSFL